MPGMGGNMKISRMVCARVVSVVALSLMAGAACAAESGTYRRPNGDIVKVTNSGGKLFCKITAGERAGFEMCHGMTKTGGSWQGANMKHPSMTIMTFNGTVTFTNAGLRIKGCAIGQSMCDAESWAKVN